MRNFLKNNFPYFFKFLKKLYHRSFLYTQHVNKIKEQNAKRSRLRLIEDLEIIKEVFNDEYFVHNGPFKGLKYISRSSGSALLPKIMGSYEEPIQDWIEKLISKHYEKIIDIGCAEGFYTAGFAMRMPDTKVIAYDIDTDAIKNSHELVLLNGLNNVELKSECTHAELNILCNERTLVFCDIEGFEHILLDPNKVPNLKKADLIIESHDFLIEGVSELLIQRFLETHKISIAIDYPFKINKYDTPNSACKKNLDRIVNEYRQPATKFIFMEHHVAI